jgi:hypothetical protein
MLKVSLLKKYPYVKSTAGIMGYGYIDHNAAGHAVKACGEIDNSRLREAGTGSTLKRLGIPDLQVGEDANFVAFGHYLFPTGRFTAFEPFGL